ncbi:PAS domain-containing protein [Rhodohalobacter halophilus]|uniref:PAS domain-containing protein n=1 Tax=Rhodohalobacter halophilus TaxID=1812810 RepID=UPI00083FA1FF|nr:PAS domain-containing protein [Rhodohalobacter halophilus]
MEKSALQNDKIGTFFTNECMLLYDYYTLDILEVNDACLRKYKFTEDEFLAKKITDLGEKFREGVRDTSSNNERFQLPAIWKHYRKDGSSFYVQFTFHQLKRNGRNVQFCILHDITNEIPDLSKKLHHLPRVDTYREQLPLATVEWDRNGIIRDWSPKAEEIFGWKFEKILGNSLFKAGVVKLSQKQMILDKIQEMTAHQTTYFTFDTAVENLEGKIIHTTWHNTANYDQAGKLLTVVSLIEDVSESRVAEERLMASEQRFRVLSEASTVGVYLIQNGHLRYVNPMFCKICGFDKNELINGIDPLELIHNQDLKKLLTIRQRFYNSEIDSFEIDARANAKDGTQIYVRIYGSKIELDGQLAIMGVVIDQTRQMEMQNKLNHSIQSYRDLFNSIGDAIYIHDESGKFTEINQTAEEIFGYTREEMIGKDPMLFAAPGKVDPKETYHYIQSALNGQRQRFEWWAERKMGRFFP